MPDPDPILEAAAQALADGGYLGCLCCYREVRPHPVWHEDRETAEAVLAVVRPLIEAETRERIAQDIEEFREHLRKFPEPEELPGGALHSFSWHRWRAAEEALTRVAAIARGKGSDWEHCEAARIARGDTTGHEQEPVK
jgi:hypothetical protein